jgi:hypothetical protein
MFVDASTVEVIFIAGEGTYALIMCYTATTVRPGTAITVKEMGGRVSAPPTSSRAL